MVLSKSHQFMHVVKGQKLKKNDNSYQALTHINKEKLQLTSGLSIYYKHPTYTSKTIYNSTRYKNSTIYRESFYTFNVFISKLFSFDLQIIRSKCNDEMTNQD